MFTLKIKLLSKNGKYLEVICHFESYSLFKDYTRIFNDLGYQILEYTY